MNVKWWEMRHAISTRNVSTLRARLFASAMMAMKEKAYLECAKVISEAFLWNSWIITQSIWRETGGGCEWEEARKEHATFQNLRFVDRNIQLLLSFSAAKQKCIDLIKLNDWNSYKLRWNLIALLWGKFIEPNLLIICNFMRTNSHQWNFLRIPIGSLTRKLWVFEDWKYLQLLRCCIAFASMLCKGALLQLVYKCLYVNVAFFDSTKAITMKFDQHRIYLKSLILYLIVCHILSLSTIIHI